MDIADFTDQLAELVQEALDSGISAAEVKATLTAKAQDIPEENGEENEEGGE
jgi:hypothetical protein